VVLLAREKRAITNYYIIKTYLQQKTFLILTQLWRNSILHCENENLIKADWLTRYVGIRDVPPNISLAESAGMGTDFQFWLLSSFYLFVCVTFCFLCVFYKLD
jgi:hypothetical protein